MDRSTTSTPLDVLILGASARAAAMSAARAGFRAWALDLFGDEDLIEASHQSRRIDHYRECFQAIADWPTMPCVVTGALENHPKLIERLAKERPFWGTPADVVRKVRSPERLRETLHQNGLPALEIWPGDAPPTTDGHWILKPKHSAGGRGIFVWDQEAARSPAAWLTLQKPHCFQKRAEGEPASAVFLSEWDRIHFVGASRLLSANAPGPPFGYGGAIGPIDLSKDVMRQLLQMGRTLAEAFPMRGLWGLDFLHDDSRVWITEVNPRYTATVELYEQAYGQALLGHHQRACESWPTGDDANRRVDIASWPVKSAQVFCIGKAVVYAPSDFIVPPWKEWTTARDALRPGLKTLADRPAEGSLVPKGHPICTLFAAASSERECQIALNDRIKALSDHLGMFGPPI